MGNCIRLDSRQSGVAVESAQSALTVAHVNMCGTSVSLEGQYGYDNRTISLWSAFAVITIVVVAVIIALAT